MQKKRKPHYSSSLINHTVSLPVPTSDLRELISTTMAALRSQWSHAATYFYKKAGVIVTDICPDNAIQPDLFDPVDRDKQARLAAAIDALNRKNGYGTVKTAIQITDNSWRMKHEHESKRYTTNLDDVIKVR